MIDRAAAPQFLLGAAAGCCAVLVVGAIGAVNTGWMLVLLPVVAFLAGHAPA